MSPDFTIRAWDDYGSSPLRGEHTRVSTSAEAFPGSSPLRGEHC